jgi:hypothetical protein
MAASDGPVPMGRIHWRGELAQAGREDLAWDRVSAYLDGLTRPFQDVEPWDAADERPPTVEDLQDIETPGGLMHEWQSRNHILPWVGLWVTANKSALHWRANRARMTDWARHRDAIAGRAIATWNSWELIWADQEQGWNDTTLPIIHTHERPLPSWH